MRRQKIIITGGAGYVGSALVPYLIKGGYDVTVVDLFIYGDHVFGDLKTSPHLHLSHGDIRDRDFLYREFYDKDILIHLACISNDPSFDLNPDLGRSINYDAFGGIIAALKESKIRRFIYASSSSVYGVSKEEHVTEETPCFPLTDYSKYKLMCEKLLHEARLENCLYTIIRPATVCGYAPRLRLDLSVNILTIHALTQGVITVWGGEQLRPHIYIDDMIEAYRILLEAPEGLIHRQTFNAGYENRSIAETALLIKNQLSGRGLKEIQIQVKPTNDPRSYHIDSTKIQRVLGFGARYSLEDAVSSLAEAFKKGLIQDPMNNTLYYNVKRMNELGLK